MGESRWAAIEALLSAKPREGRTIEYKRELPGPADGDRKEFLADVSSFANTVGGDIVFGVEEAAGLPIAIVGLGALDVDEELCRLDGIVQSGLDPRIRYGARAVKCFSEATVLVIRIEQSWVGPHRVTFKGHDKFYARNSVGKYALDVEELRQAFLGNAAVGDRIRTFRAERLLEIGRGRTPTVVPEGAKLVLHFIPREAFSTARVVDVVRYFRNPSLLPPMGRGGWGHRMTLDGVLTDSAEPNGALYYTHLYRNGVIEAVDGYILNRQYEGRWLIPSVAFEETMLGAVGKYLRTLTDLGVAPPVYVFMSLLSVKDRWMGVSAESGDSGFPIDRSIVQLPEAVVMDLGERPDAIMRATIDAIWNACGFEGSQNYDEQGRWRRRS